MDEELKTTKATVNGHEIEIGVVFGQMKTRVARKEMGIEIGDDYVAMSLTGPQRDYNGYADYRAAQTGTAQAIEAAGIDATEATCIIEKFL